MKAAPLLLVIILFTVACGKKAPPRPITQQSTAPTGQVQHAR